MRVGEDPGGYRIDPAGGPRLRTDIVDVYIFRRAGRGDGVGAGPAGDSAAVEFLQLLRAGDPLGGTWHPVMGHVEAGETAAACALRELREEVGLEAGSGALIGMWALEQVHPYFVAAIDAVVLSPRFAAEVGPGWEPRINDEHTGARWVRACDVPARFMWPGQAAACREIAEWIVPEGSPARQALRVHPGG